MAFTFEEQRPGIELCADLAFQARCAELWTAGVVKLIYLTNVLDGGAGNDILVGGEGGDAATAPAMRPIMKLPRRALA